ncbi:hypothetical protein ES705_28300 [subsurface metagenome]
MSIDDTGVISWESPTVGDFVVTVTVTDGVLSDTQPFTITVIPVVELTSIEVTPETMDLKVGEFGTFKVIAHYSDATTKNVSYDCVYFSTSDAAKVSLFGPTDDSRSVEALKVGQANITATYQGMKDTLVVAVRIPMEIAVASPLTFKVGGPYWFTVEMIANGDSGKLVVASFGWPTSGEVKIEGTLETDVGSDLTFELTGDVFQTDVFTMEDVTANFRGTFTSPGTYLTTIEVKTSPGDDLLCGQDITIVVVPLVVGDIYGGGIVAHIDGTGQHGLIAATVDQSDGIAWITGGSTQIKLNGNTSTDYGAGQANTIAMMAQFEYTGGAAQVCDDYSVTVDGITYDDWFLPSRKELRKLYKNRETIGDFATDYSCWSSSEWENNTAFYQNFDDTAQAQAQYVNFKSETYRVRAVRAF